MTLATETSEASTSRSAQVHDYRLHYHDVGEGPVVVMLHGGGPGANGWSTFRLNVEAFAPHFRCLIVDLPGFGKSDAVVIPDDRWQFNARAVAGLLEVLGVDQPVSLVGNSAGGASALEFALQFPQRTAKLVLMGPGGGGASQYCPLPTEGDRLLMATFREPNEANMRRLFEVMLYDHSLIDDALIRDRVMAAQNPEQREARRKSARKVGEPLLDLEKIEAPTLLVWGRDDRFNPYDIGIRMLSLMPNAQLHVFSHCGHWVQQEHPEAFNRLVVDFLTH
ncbi:MAG: alpha/beta fold hydrolase [Chloroflexi bacterium]|nr:alpha/beta fold hydrolase [Chloroflexota bacterium]